MSEISAPVMISPREDPLAFVLSTPDAAVTAQPLVAAMNQRFFRSLLYSYLHEAPEGHWYRHAASLNGESLPYHRVLLELLSMLDGVSEEQARVLAHEPPPGGMAAWITELYATYRRVLPPAEGEWLEAPASQERLACPLPRNVQRMAREFGGIAGLSLYLHGSLATCDATAYSDVDTLLIVPHDCLQSAAKLDALRTIVQNAQPWLYLQDPLQHHGFMVVTALDLERYAKHYFPLELLRYAYSLTPTETIRYRVRGSAEESRSLLYGSWRRLVRLETGAGPAPTTRFELKAVLSETMLIPTYFLQVRGQVLYKRESFGAVRELLSPPARVAMDELSEWRQDWRLSWWDAAYRSTGGSVPRAVRTRLLARARLSSITDSDAARWKRVLPAARAMAAELLEAAASSHP